LTKKLSQPHRTNAIKLCDYGQIEQLETLYPECRVQKVWMSIAYSLDISMPLKEKSVLVAHSWGEERGWGSKNNKKFR